MGKEVEGRFEHCTLQENKYLLRTYYMPASVLGFGDGAKNKTDRNFLLTGPSTIAGETINKQVSI